MATIWKPGSAISAKTRRREEGRGGKGEGKERKKEKGKKEIAEAFLIC